MLNAATPVAARWGSFIRGASGVRQMIVSRWKTIGGVLFPKLQPGMHSYFWRRLESAHRTVYSLVREAAKNSAEEVELEAALDHAERHLEEVAKRLKAARDDPSHFGDNRPGWFDSDGNPITPARYSHIDLIGYGPSGDGGLQGFLDLCGMPPGTGYEHLTLAAAFLDIHDALQFFDADMAYALHLLDVAMDWAEHIKVSRARAQLEQELPQKVLDAAFSELQSERAKARYAHDRSGKQWAKGEVKGWWRQWRDNPSLYPSAASFARAMLDKYPDQLTSQPVIEQWVRDWKAEAQTP